MEAEEVAVESGKSLGEALRTGAGAGGAFGVLGLLVGVGWWNMSGFSDWDCQFGRHHEIVRSIGRPAQTANGFCSKVIKVPGLGIAHGPVILGAVLGIVFAFVALVISGFVIIYKDSKRSKDNAARPHS